MKGFLSKAANLVGKTDALGHQSSRSADSAALEQDPVLQQLLSTYQSKHARKLFFAHPASEYTEVHDVHVLAGTYNVAGKRPPPGFKLTDWLGAWRSSWPAHSVGAGRAAGPDVVVVGFQEVVPLSAGNVIAGPTSDGADAWDTAVAATLNGDDWATANQGRFFGNSSASAALLDKLGTQAYSVLSSQAALVASAMDRMWQGQPGGGASPAAAADGVLAAAQAEQLWQARRTQLLDSPESDDVYVQVTSKQMVGLYLSVWARKSVARYVRGVQAITAATGWGGYLGNKGAVAVRLRVYDTPLCVVCSHLASGEQEGDELKRNSDYAEICKRCLFPRDTDLRAAGAAGALLSGNWGGLQAINEHSNAIWLGDLNYRITSSDEEARRLIKAGKLEKLQQYDQLIREMGAGRVFQGWREGPVTFNPTYKYHLGCHVYSGEPLPPALVGVKGVDSTASLPDSSSATDAEGDGSGTAAGLEKQKKRVPAWCDRILWRQGGKLHQLAYGRAEIAVSDHRPVAAAFLLEGHYYTRAAVKDLLEAARREADVAHQPRCTLEPYDVTAGVVAYGDPRSYSITLKNTGTVEACWMFLPLDSGIDDNAGLDPNAPVGPPWLSISPQQGCLEAGGEVVIQLGVCLEGGPKGGATQLYAQPNAKMDTVLILRVADGRDFFVSILGSFLRSSFGMDLDALITLGQEPALDVAALGPQEQEAVRRAMAAARASGGGGEDLLGLGEGQGQGVEGQGGEGEGLESRVPKEVLRLVHWLEAEGRLQTPGVFLHSYSILAGRGPSPVQPRSPADIHQLLTATAAVRWAVDTCQPLPPTLSTHHVAAALLLMFQQLPEPFVPPVVAGVLHHSVPGGSQAATLLSDSMTAVEWATCRRVLRMLRAALAPPAAGLNGLQLPDVAAVVAEYWFAGSGPAPSEVLANRVAFLMALIDPEAAAAYLGGADRAALAAAGPGPAAAPPEDLL